ncbi:hypothetical protein SAMN04488029_1792 [Reichenbachiella faecimaris]|uniref:Uncharacterized protein n=1 Tax=Reichenbachiella faecimaris TaxID=692418 RepID=A0A1W2GBN4_REIFA|nr:hypothetical protein [Reichenbachiella faecimaris]SMD34011.1 hypothetical protein SAMN04488029_1792 [Reichenbachiella faecimaris]
MTKEQINRLEMAQATNAYLDTHAAVWSAIPIISNYKTTLIQAIQGIQTASLVQESSQVFIGGSLRELKYQIAQKMDILDDLLEAFAADTANAELLSLSSNSASDYFRLSHEDFEIKTKNVIDLLETNLEDMTDYGMSAEQIEEVKTSFAVFQDKRGVPRSYQIQSRMATDDLASLFDEVNKTLSRMDNVLKRFKRANPSFFTGYQAARHIVKD